MKLFESILNRFILLCTVIVVKGYTTCIYIDKGFGNA